MAIQCIEPNLGKIPEVSTYSVQNKLKTGIIVRSPNWLGDAIMSLPALKQIKKMLPQGKKLFVLSPNGLKDLYLALDIVDEVIILKQAHKNWTKDDIRNVRQCKAGVAVLFNNSPRDAIFLRLAGVSNLFGASSGIRNILMRRTYKYPKRLSKEFNIMHHSAKYLSMAYAICAEKWDGEFPKIKINTDKVSEKFIAMCAENRIMSLSPGAAYGQAKMWASENFREVAKSWVDKGGRVVVLGTDKEKETAEIVLKDLPTESVYDLTGKTTMIELMYILKQSKICIANDSGIMHLSGALDAPGIAIYGSTDPFATSPLSKKWKLLIDKQECAPCFKRECHLNNHPCMNAVKPIDVITNISGFDFNVEQGKTIFR